MKNIIISVQRKKYYFKYYIMKDDTSYDGKKGQK